MYRSPYSNYVIDPMCKYHCVSCDKHFIASSFNDKDINFCPFCGERSPENVVVLDDPDILGSLGCVAIGRMEGSGERWI